MEEFKVIIVEDVQLELKGTEHIFRSEIPEATIIGTAQNEAELWKLMRKDVPDMILLDLGLGGSTTVGIDICRQLRDRYSNLKILIFTGEIQNERLWVEALSAGADGIILKQETSCNAMMYNLSCMDDVSCSTNLFWRRYLPASARAY